MLYDLEELLDAVQINWLATDILMFELGKSWCRINALTLIICAAQDSIGDVLEWADVPCKITKYLWAIEEKKDRN